MFGVERRNMGFIADSRRRVALSSFVRKISSMPTKKKTSIPQVM
jgi:hypothetical protein